MLSQELWLENEKKCAVVRKSKPGRKRQELLAVALGVKVGVKGSFLWPPLKLFACSQISSLVRRAALTHNDNHFNYEKTHNFKVSLCILSSAVQGRWGGVFWDHLGFPSGLWWKTNSFCFPYLATYFTLLLCIKSNRRP
jgi:hypothetical protein